jgi:hypothetical protein
MKERAVLVLVLVTRRHRQAPQPVGPLVQDDDVARGQAARAVDAGGGGGGAGGGGRGAGGVVG